VTKAAEAYLLPRLVSACPGLSLTRFRGPSTLAALQMAQRKRYLFVCVNRRPDGTPKGSCAAKGSVELHAKLKAMLKQRGLDKTEVRACTSSCLDTCWVGPTIAVEPDHYFYGRVQESDLEEIVQALATGGRVERLLLAPEDFVEPHELKKLASKS
jgi:(2Fe-2S) ferredoxin